MYGLPETGLVATAVVDRLGEPVTPDVASVSLFLNPVIVAVSVGFRIAVAARSCCRP